MRRLPDRARYDRATVHAILDEGLVCHVGFVDEGQPFVIPSAYARVGDRLVIHGSAASRMVKALAGGAPACVTVTLLDGLVLARSGFHHSMNYRSVVVARPADRDHGPGEKRRALDAIVEHVVPGRVASVRPPSENELRAHAGRGAAPRRGVGQGAHRARRRTTRRTTRSPSGRVSCPCASSRSSPSPIPASAPRSCPARRAR